MTPEDGGNDCKNKPENMEAVLEAIGGFGWFQAMALFLLLSLEIPTAMMILLPVFIGASPSTWQCDNDTVSRIEACECEGDLFPVDLSATVVSEWSLICGAVWVSDTILTGQWVGTICGNMFTSQLSDWYGRRRSLLVVGLQMAFGTVLTAIAPNPYVYLFARFICGAGYSACVNNLTSYTVEFMTPKWRPLGSALSPFGWGMMLLGLLAYLIRPWRTLAMVTAAPFAMVIFVFLLVPESPRWLLKNQRVDECEKVIQFIAKFNGAEPVDRAALDHLAEKERKACEESEKTDSGNRLSVLDFYRDKELRKRVLSLQGIWFTRSLIYFGISYNIKNQPGDPYLTMVYMGLVDTLANPSSLLITNRLGRRQSIFFTMTLTAIFLVVIAILQLIIDFSNYGTLLMVLCVLARYGTAASRSVTRTFTAESFPTGIRTKAVGLAKTPGSIAGALSAQLVLLGSLWPSIPFFTFAVIGAGGSMLGFMLQEPAGKPLEEHVISTSKKSKKDEVP